MKHAVNFRLSTRATTVLSILEKKMHTSKTAIVEKALQFYAQKELSKQSRILDFAGILTDKEADDMLSVIESSNHNKDLKINL
ncbi:MAG: hypothetical protein EPO11_08940 [Gammaproteobacteria bacterium]|nr:MAG: hypothetical protein EPO11_08940 [Gammaproteobacteria bacterium]